MNINKIVIVCAVIAEILCGYSLAHAQDKPAGTCTTFAEATESSTCVVMRRGNIRGVWLTLERSEMLRKEHLALPELQHQLELRQKELEKALEASKLYKAAADKRADIQVTLEKQLKESQLSESKAIERADAWWRSPLLWLGVGAVLGGTVVAAVAL